MARQKADAAKDAGSIVEARALVDLPGHGVKSGGLIKAEAAQIALLAQNGMVDTHPESVAYAKANP